MSNAIKKNKILYFYTIQSTFIQKDIEIISSEFSVKIFMFNVYNKKKLIIIFFKQFLFLFINIFNTKIVISQFAGIHSCLPVLFAKLFFKKSVIVAGGTDCVSFPSINYGNFANKNNSFFTRFCFKHTSIILPVHKSLIFYDYNYQPYDFKHQGIKQFIPNLKTNYTVIYNGYDSKYWHHKFKLKNSKSFVTVLGHVNSKFTLLLKGIDLYVEIAKKFTDCTFTIIGGKSLIIEDKPNNLFLEPTIWGEKMVDVFSSHQFYVQLSISEGFPNALSEAMLCECIPIVSNVGGMPDIVEDCGYILKQKNINDVYKLVTLALNNNDAATLGRKARKRIKTNYTFENRKNKLLNELQKLI